MHVQNKTCSLHSPTLAHKGLSKEAGKASSELFQAMHGDGAPKEMKVWEMIRDGILDTDPVAEGLVTLQVWRLMQTSKANPKLNDRGDPVGHGNYNTM